MTPKIIELVIQDDDIEAGLDGIALVEMPAHEANFEYFSQEPIEEKCSHYILADEKIPQIIQMFHAFGEPQGLLEKEGFYIAEVRNVGKKEFATIISNPNDSSAQDTPDVRFRYKYVGPRDEKNRTFCAEMMKAQRVFRIEDIMEMSNLSVNEVGPDGYDIFTWRGSYNCRHRWVQLIYKAEGRIVNNTLVEKGLEDTDDMPGPDTRTTATIAAGNTPPRVGFSTEGNPNVSALAPYVDQVTKKVVKKPVLASLPMFKNREDAEAMAEAIGCKGSHSMQYGTEVLWMPCETHEPEGDEEHPDMYGLEDENMSKFSSEEAVFSVFNNEQRLLLGPAMIPDKMIIRRNEITGEIYYVYFTAETIKKLQQKFMQEKLLDKTNIEHGRKFLSGVDVVESWIVEDQTKDKQQVFGMNYPKGTWMVSVKVNDDATWGKVKDGKLKGFSVQGYFLEKAKFNAETHKVLDEIKNILKEIK